MTKIKKLVTQQNCGVSQTKAKYGQKRRRL